MMTKLGLFATFGRLAEPPGPGTGAWQIATDDGHAGTVVMEAGRICWADERAGGPGDALGRGDGVTGATIDEVIRACCARRPPLAGALAEPQPAAVIRDHTCRSILGLVKAGVRDCAWIPHLAGGYAPTTTLSVPQAACGCVAVVKGLDSDRLERALELMLAGEAAGVLIHASARLPLAASRLAMTWSELRRWLTWALKIDDTCPLASRGYLAGRGDRGGWTLWRAGDVLGLAVTSSADAQRRVLVRVASALPDWTVELAS